MSDPAFFKKEAAQTDAKDTRSVEELAKSLKERHAEVDLMIKMMSLTIKDISEQVDRLTNAKAKSDKDENDDKSSKNKNSWCTIL